MPIVLQPCKCPFPVFVMTIDEINTKKKKSENTVVESCRGFLVVPM
jgi:hypothetical protein